MGKTIRYKDNTKWRNKFPNQHKSFGEKRNRDLKKYILSEDFDDERW